MGEMSIVHWVIVAVVILILFGGRKIPEVMRGLGEGIRSFKDGMAGNSQPPNPPAQASSTPAPAATERPAEEKK